MVRRHPASEQEVVRLSTGAIVVKKLFPLNLDTERKKWLANRQHSPHFEYEAVRIGEDRLRKLRELRFDDSFQGQILGDKRNESVKIVELLWAVGRENFTEMATRLFPWPDAETVRQAKQALKKTKWGKEKGPYFDFRQLKKIFEWRFGQYGLNWEVRGVDFPGGKLSVNKSGALNLGLSTRYSLERTMTAVVHEIDTHVLRTENGKLQPLRVFQTGLPGYTKTEEGLAVYRVNKLGLNILKVFIPQIRVIALDIARRASFAQTAAAVMDLGLTPKQAWSLVWRLKRGLADTGRPGGFAKDGLYYSGCCRVAAFAEKGGRINDLYVGKIGLEHLEMISRLPGLIKPRYLPLPLKREDLERFV